MIALHPQIISRENKKEFVVLPYEEWLALQEALEDAEDLSDLNAAIAEEGDTPTKSLDEIKRQFDL